MSDQKSIESIICLETERVKRKRPYLEEVSVSYERQSSGLFITRMRAKTKKKSFYLVEENRNPQSAVKKIFNDLNRLLNKKKYIGLRSIRPDHMEAS